MTPLENAIARSPLGAAIAARWKDVLEWHLVLRDIRGQALEDFPPGAEWPAAWHEGQA